MSDAVKAALIIVLLVVSLAAALLVSLGASSPSVARLACAAGKTAQDGFCYQASVTGQTQNYDILPFLTFIGDAR